MASIDALTGHTLVDANGTPYPGARAFYWADVGISTPLATYSNASLTTPNTAPVTADASGTFGPIFLAAARYFRTVTTAAGVTLPQFCVGPIDPAPGWIVSATAPSPTYKAVWPL